MAVATATTIAALDQVTPPSDPPPQASIRSTWPMPALALLLDT